MSAEDLPQERRLHVLFSGIGESGSSLSSSSRGSGVEDRAGGATEESVSLFGSGIGTEVPGAVVVLAIGFSRGSSGVGIGGCFDGSLGVSSSVECLPVVHGGMVKNSSNVRTRGLQHFQPEIESDI